MSLLWPKQSKSLTQSGEWIIVTMRWQQVTSPVIVLLEWLHQITKLTAKHQQIDKLCRQTINNCQQIDIKLSAEWQFLGPKWVCGWVGKGFESQNASSLPCLASLETHQLYLQKQSGHLRSLPLPQLEPCCSLGSCSARAVEAMELSRPSDSAQQEL